MAKFAKIFDVGDGSQLVVFVNGMNVEAVTYMNSTTLHLHITFDKTNAIELEDFVHNFTQDMADAVHAGFLNSYNNTIGTKH